jgi:molecular chaperone GrpE (heat shock protein)
MGLLDGIERLINEHGSATILKERIELANDKYSALEEKNSILEQKVTMLESENKTLRLNIEKAEVEVQNLKKLTEKSHNSRLEEIREKILQLLSVHDEANSQQISHAISANEQVVNFHLTELEDLNLINPSYIMNSPVIWSIAHEGRKYLITHGLLA